MPQMPFQPQINQAAQVALPAVRNVANAIPQVVNKVAQTPVLGNQKYNVGQLFNDTVQKPFINPAVQGGQALTQMQINNANNRPTMQGINTPQLIGNAITTGINGATMGGGSLLANGAEKLAAPLLGKLGGGLAAKAATNFVRTTAATLPATAAYGGASVLQQGDTNPLDILKGVGQGALMAPAMGIVHGALPVAGAGIKATGKGAQAVTQTLADANKAVGQAGHIDLGATIGKDAGKGVAPDPKNFKTADAFIKAHGEPQYHGTDRTFNIADAKPTSGTSGTGINLINSKEVASGFGKNVHEVYPSLHNPLDISGNITASDASRLNKAFQGVKFQAGDKGTDVVSLINTRNLSEPDVISRMKSAGYDGFVRQGNGTKVSVPLEASQLKTKQQLTDIYNQAPSPSVIGKDKPVAEPKLPTRGLTKGIKGSPNFSPELQKAVTSEYAPSTNKAALEGQAKFAKQSLNKQNNTALSHLSSHAPVGKQEVVNFGKTIQALDAAGKTDQATVIHNLLAKKLTESGQTSQAASLLYNRTPEGMQNVALKTLRNAKVPVTPELTAKIQVHINALKAAPEGTQAHFEAAQALAKTVNRLLPSKNTDKLFRLWRTGLLTGPQTMSKVGISHAIQNGLEAVSSVPATGLDHIIAGVRDLVGKDGFNSTAITARGQGDFIKGTKAGIKLLATGKDTLNSGGFQGFNTEIGRPQARFTGAFKFLNGYMDKTEQIHAAIPKGFYTAAYSNDLNKQAIAAWHSGEGTGTRSAFIKNFVNNPSEAAHAEAQHAGQMATFQQQTKLGGVAAKVQSVPGGKVLSPFAHIASAILTDAANYSPVGLVKPVIEAVKDNGAAGWTPTVQKHLVEGLGRGITGTAAMGAGYALYKAGVMALDYPTDPKQQALWKASGKQPNSILLNGQWRQLASLGPEAITLGMGGYAASANDVGGKGNAAIASIAGALKTLSGESFLSGVTGAAGAINNPQMNAASFLKNQASSIIPIAVGTLAKALDPTQRQTNNALEAIQSKIPGLRQGLIPSQTGLGQDVPRQGGVATNLTDPTRPNNAANNPVMNELNRLDATHNTVFPVPVKTIGSGVNAVKLTPQQTYDRNAMVGPQIQAAYQNVINSAGYAGLSDANKAKALANAASDINSVGNVNTLQAVGSLPQAQQSYKGLSVNQKAMLAGSPTNKNYTALDANGKAISTTSDPAATYQAHLATFKAAQAAGTLTGAKAFSTQQALTKESITSQYPQPVLDFYSLSKTAASAYLNTLPAAQANQIYSQAQQLDNQLKSSGQTATSKYKYGLGTKPKVAKALKMPKMPKIAALKSSKFSVKAPKVGKIKLAKISKLPIWKAPKVTKSIAFKGPAPTKTPRLKLPKLA